MELRYIHTLEGKVAGFDEEQIVFAPKPRKNGWHPKAITNLNQIKLEQRKSKRFRKSHGFDDTSYSYVIVEV